MRLYQWSNQGLHLPSLLFEGDAEDGGCIVLCGFCGERFNTLDKEVCPHCKKDLVFPRAEW